jgi:hypothetical protein
MEYRHLHGQPSCVIKMPELDEHIRRACMFKFIPSFIHVFRTEWVSLVLLCNIQTYVS